MTRFALVSSLALAVAAPAFANPQLAASLGLDAGAYTTNELVAIAAAREDDNRALERFLVNGGGSDVVSTQNGVSAGQAQLAASVGVDAANYTTAELAAIGSAREDDNRILANFLVNGGSDVVSTQNGISAGHEQLARSLGLDASEYSLNELAAIAADRYDDN